MPDLPRAEAALPPATASMPSRCAAPAPVAGAGPAAGEAASLTPREHGRSRASRVIGCLVDGRGFAAIREDGRPGRHACSNDSGAEYTVEERLIGSRRATNRAGAAEILGRSIKTINLLASPKGRADGSGFPAAISTEGGQDWYAIADVEAFARTYRAQVEATGRARSDGVVLDGDPDELITAVEFRQAIDIEAKSWTKYVGISKDAWARGEDGYLPRPDSEEPVTRGRGVTRKWTRRRAQAWIDARTGPNPGPGRPPVAATSTAPQQPA